MSAGKIVAIVAILLLMATVLASCTGDRIKSIAAPEMTSASPG